MQNLKPHRLVWRKERKKHETLQTYGGNSHSVAVGCINRVVPQQWRCAAGWTGSNAVKLKTKHEMKMKSIITLAMLLAAAAHADIAVETANCVTNGITSTNIADTNAPKKDWGKYDLTLGGDGFTQVRSGKTGVEVDVGLSTDPFKQFPNLWLEVDQGVSWDSGFSGSTDFTGYWSFDIWKDTVYFNPGWSAGEVYGSGPSYLRTGPVVELQYYITDAVFVYTDINYDAVMSRGDHGLRYSFGMGFEF